MDDLDLPHAVALDLHDLLVEPVRRRLEELGLAADQPALILARQARVGAVGGQRVLLLELLADEHGGEGGAALVEQIDAHALGAVRRGIGQVELRMLGGIGGLLLQPLHVAQHEQGLPDRRGLDGVVALLGEAPAVACLLEGVGARVAHDPHRGDVVYAPGELGRERVLAFERRLGGLDVALEVHRSADERRGGERQTDECVLVHVRAPAGPQPRRAEERASIIFFCRRRHASTPAMATSSGTRAALTSTRLALRPLMSFSSSRLTLRSSLRV